MLKAARGQAVGQYCLEIHYRFSGLIVEIEDGGKHLEIVFADDPETDSGINLNRLWGAGGGGLGTGQANY
jgi:hypothetical protein